MYFDPRVNTATKLAFKVQVAGVKLVFWVEKFKVPKGMFWHEGFNP